MGVVVDGYLGHGVMLPATVAQTLTELLEL